MDAVVSANTTYFYKRSYYQPTAIGWHQLLAPNPSRWSLWLRELGPGTALFSPVPDIVFDALFDVSLEKPDLKLTCSHFPGLVASAWYVYYDTLPSGAGCEAYEVTLTGT